MRYFQHLSSTWGPPLVTPSSSSSHPGHRICCVFVLRTFWPRDSDSDADSVFGFLLWLSGNFLLLWLSRSCNCTYRQQRRGKPIAFKSHFLCFFCMFFISSILCLSSKSQHLIHQELFHTVTPTQTFSPEHDPLHHKHRFSGAVR